MDNKFNPFDRKKMTPGRAAAIEAAKLRAALREVIDRVVDAKAYMTPEQQDVLRRAKDLL